jgi:hypothetical protein
MKPPLVIRAVRKLTGWQRVLFFRGEAPPQETNNCRQLRQVDAAAAEKWKAPWQPWILQDRIRKGAQLYAWIIDEKPACYGWVSETRFYYISEVRASCEFREPTVCFWDCVTPEELRNRGYYTELLRALLFQHAAKNPIIYSASENMASKRGITKAGFVAIGSIVGTRLGIKSFLAPDVTTAVFRRVA